MTNRKSQNGPLVPKKAWIAFFFWLFPISLVTLWTLWKLTQPNTATAHATRERAHLGNRVALIAPVRFQRQ